MGSEAIQRTAKRLGRFIPPGFCYYHAVRPPFWPAKAKRCTAVCSAKRRPERRGLRCRLAAVRNYTKCRMHGGGTGGARKAFRTPAERQAKRRAEIEQSDRLYALWLAKQAKPKPIVWEPAPKASLEDSFRSHHRKRDKGWSPY
jgi:hypothetical protein